jgi:hypothetical protein
MSRAHTALVGAFSALTGLSLGLLGARLLPRTRPRGSMYTMNEQIYIDQPVIDLLTEENDSRIIQGPRWSQINLQAYTLTYEAAPDALQRRPERLYRLRHPETDANAADGDAIDAARELAQGLSRRKNDELARERVLFMAKHDLIGRQILA